MASLAAADASVRSSQAGLDSATAKLTELQAGPSKAELRSAEADVKAAKEAESNADDNNKASAKARRQAAEAKLKELKDGPKPADLASAQASVASAQANLDSATAKLKALKAPPSSFDLTTTQRWTRDRVDPLQKDALYTVSLGYTLPSATVAALSVAREQVGDRRGGVWRCLSHGSGAVGINSKCRPVRPPRSAGPPGATHGPRRRGGASERL